MCSNTHEDDPNVIQGPKSSITLSKETAGKYLYRLLIGASPNKVAMIDAISYQTLTYADLLQQSINLAQALRLRNYQKPDQVMAIYSENNVEYFIVVLAALFNGTPLTPINPSYKNHELRHTLSISKPKVVFCSESCALKLAEIISEMGFVEEVVVIGKKVDDDNNETLEQFIGGKSWDVSKFQPVEGISSDMLAFILYSSGTTGLPKGVATSHLNLMTRFAHGKDPQYYYQDPNFKVLGLLPFFHAYGITFTLDYIASHQTVVCLRKFEEHLFLSTIQNFQIDVLPLAPALAIFLAKSSAVAKYNLSSVKDMLCSAAPLKETIENEVKRRLNCNSLRQALGMTETTSTVTMIGINDKKKSGSCGRIASFTCGKVRDRQSGKSLGPREVGEICFKGSLIMMGYYKNPAANKEAFTEDGWLKSGDLGFYDEEGYFYVVDRLKEFIKYKGFQIAPAELEDVLLKNENIVDAGVVGVPDELAGELPVAFVVRKPGSALNEETVKKWVAGLVSHQKWIRGGVIFVEKIPRNPSGKILRKLLKEDLKYRRSGNLADINVESKL